MVSYLAGYTFHIGLIGTFFFFVPHIELLRRATGFAWPGPRDARGQPGPYEAALTGHRLADPKRPIEILRTIHSFDPCIACAVHVCDPEAGELVEVRIQ